MVKNFLMIDSLSTISESDIKGTRNIKTPDYWIYLEAAAQLCSIHVRWLLKLSKHSFLLKIKFFNVYQSELGNLKYSASLVSMGENSYKYMITGCIDKNVVVKGEIIIGTKDYTSAINELNIKKYYTGIFKCLMKDII